jgi:hypothetical protein
LTISISEFRDFAGRWLRDKCGPGSGYAESHDVYQAITEGRDAPPWPNTYSSCGDLAHAFLEACGVRFTWINRASLGQYKNGKNVSRLAWNVFARPPEDGERFEAGDVLITWNDEGPLTKDAHVRCVLEHDPKSGVLVTAEYGQPGAAVKRCTLIDGVVDDGITGHEPKRLRRVLPLAVVLEEAERLGRLVPVDEDGRPLPQEST